MSVQSAPSLSGMRGFLVIWVGQVVSFMGTGMSRFALTLWAWEMTGEATALALTGFFGFAPQVLLSPIAGALIDRWDRKFAMLISDLVAGLSTVALLMVIALAGIGQLQLWHVFIAVFVAGLGEAFQFPAYSAAISTLLKKEHYGRASGLLSIAESASSIFAPILGGLLYTTIGLIGVLLIDVITFGVAVVCLLLVHIPAPVRSEEGDNSRKAGFVSEILYGFRYILARPSLLGLQLVFFGINFVSTFAFIILPAMILSRTGVYAEGGDKVLLGGLQSVASVGGLLGGILLGVWGGPKKKVHGVLLGMIGSSLIGTLILGVGQAALWWAVGSFFSAFFIPLLNGSNQAIWQAKVAPDVQGRVFSARRTIAQITAPIAMLLAGPLADRVFEPAMAVGGPWVPLFGGLVGQGPGAGMALMIVLGGVLGVVIGVAGYAFPAIREAETRLPDHVQAVAPSSSE